MRASYEGEKYVVEDVVVVEDIVKAAIVSDGGKKPNVDSEKKKRRT